MDLNYNIVDKVADGYVGLGAHAHFQDFGYSYDQYHHGRASKITAKSGKIYECRGGRFPKSPEYRLVRLSEIFKNFKVHSNNALYCGTRMEPR